jgi:hypothetical protein
MEEINTAGKQRPSIDVAKKISFFKVHRAVPGNAAFIFRKK